MGQIGTLRPGLVIYDCPIGGKYEAKSLIGYRITFYLFTETHVAKNLPPESLLHWSGWMETRDPP